MSDQHRDGEKQSFLIVIPMQMIRTALLVLQIIPPSKFRETHSSHKIFDQWTQEWGWKEIIQKEIFFWVVILSLLSILTSIR